MKDGCWPQANEVMAEVFANGKVINIDKMDADDRRFQMRCCLVGKVEGGHPTVHFLQYWGKKYWNLSGELIVKIIPNNLFLFVLPSKAEAERILKERRREWGGIFHLLNV